MTLVGFLPSTLQSRGVLTFFLVVPEFQIDTHLQKHEDELNLLLKTYIAHLEAVKLRAGKFPSLSEPPSTKLTQSMLN